MTLYGWLPDVNGSLLYEVPPESGGDVGVDIGSILDNLQMTFMGTFEARKERFSVLADVIFLGLSNSRQTSIDLGNTPVNADVNLESDYWVVITAVGYTMVDTPQVSMDALGGLRYLSADISRRVDVLGERKFSNSESIWDGVVGLRGNYYFNKNWYMPFYGDIGAGESDLTWQAMLGLGYAFEWGDVKVVYRHLEYDQSNEKFIQDLNFSGPAVGVSFKF
jgi:hypothetical protein